MTWLATKRIFRAGVLDFARNPFVSFSSILTMVETLFILGLMIFSGIILNTTLTELHDKADVNVDFVQNAPESEILELQKSVEALPQVASTQYVSAADALTRFREFHKNDQLTLSALHLSG